VTRAAFNLVELIAVMAIIAVLAAVAVPVMDKARSAAHDAGCRRNLRALHAAFLAYCADNSGKLPVRHIVHEGGNLSKAELPSDPASDPDPVTNRDIAVINLLRYLGIPTDTPDGTELWRHWTRNPDVLWGREKELMGPLVCPADRRKNTSARSEAEYLARTGLSSIGGTAGDLANRHPSYPFNNAIWGTGYINSPSLGYSPHTLRLSELDKNPFLFVDGASYSISPAPGGFDSTAKGVRYRHGAPVDYDIECQKTAATLRSGGHANAVFLDGSIRSFKDGAMPGMKTAFSFTTPAIPESSSDPEKQGYHIWIPISTR
jgi:prepilin-type N-terminal cleavage/methylation domain-containing protein